MYVPIFFLCDNFAKYQLYQGKEGDVLLYDFSQVYHQAYKEMDYLKNCYLHLLKKYQPKSRTGTILLMTLTVNVLVHQWVRFELEWTPWPWNGKQVSAFAALPFAEHAVLLLLLLD